MATNPIYERLLPQVTDETERRIMEILVEHVGQENRIACDDLVRQAIYGYGSFARPKATDDRKVRLAIASLQEQGYPILSDSGEGGRWLAKPEEIETYVAELESRREALAQKIRALRQADKLAWIDPPKPLLQERLF